MASRRKPCRKREQSVRQGDVGHGQATNLPPYGKAAIPPAAFTTLLDPRVLGVHLSISSLPRLTCRNEHDRRCQVTSSPEKTDLGFFLVARAQSEGVLALIQSTGGLNLM